MPVGGDVVDARLGGAVGRGVSHSHRLRGGRRQGDDEGRGRRAARSWRAPSPSRSRRIGGTPGVIVPVACALAIVAPLGAKRLIVKLLAGASAGSASTVTVIVSSVWPAGKVNVVGGIPT